MKKQLRQIITAVFLLCLLLSGCGAEPSGAGETSGVYAVVTDDMGRQVVLDKQPQHVVVLSTSLLNFTDAVQGDIVGRAAVKAEEAELPDRYAAVPDVGPVYNISLEKIVSLSPDLVVAGTVQHQKLISRLEQLGIPVIALRTKTYEDVKRNITVLGQIYGREELAKAEIRSMDRQIQTITKKLPAVHKRAVIIHATPNSVTVQLSPSIAGCIADILGLENVGADGTIDGSAEKIPYSMEALVEKDPDIIFFTSMGPTEKIESRIRRDVQNNPAWNALGAVRRGDVYVLPERYFLLNPGLQYPDAVAHMAKLAYPEVFHE